MPRIWFVSIARQANPAAAPEALYAGIGMNTGNLLFTNAVWRQIAWTESGSGFILDPDRINAEFDAVVIPAANWLYERFDFGDLADRIEKVRVPVVLIGIGAQAGAGMAIPVLPDGTLRLLRAVSERSALIGTRGDFSSHVLNEYGIRNHKPVGCPSLYLAHEKRPVVEKRALRRVMVGGTRYGLPRREPTPEESLHRSLYAAAAKEDFDINFQSERPEIDLLVQWSLGTEIDAERLPPSLVSYYGFDDRERLKRFLERHGRVYLDVDRWIGDMPAYDLYVGSRIHGAIAALLAGTPALLVAHDSRTAELGAFAAIPQVEQRQHESIDAGWINAMYSRLDFGPFERQMDINFRSYVEFLNANGLPHHLEGTMAAASQA